MQTTARVSVQKNDSGKHTVTGGVSVRDSARESKRNVGQTIMRKRGRGNG